MNSFHSFCYVSFLVSSCFLKFQFMSFHWVSFIKWRHLFLISCFLWNVIDSLGIAHLDLGLVRMHKTAYICRRFKFFKLVTWNMSFRCLLKKIKFILELASCNHFEGMRKIQLYECFNFTVKCCFFLEPATLPAYAKRQNRFQFFHIFSLTTLINLLILFLEIFFDQI